MSTDRADDTSVTRSRSGAIQLMLAGTLGAIVSIALGVYGNLHRPTGGLVSTLGFSSLLDMKVWFATAAAGLGFGQVLTAAGMWGRLPGVRGTPAWLAPLHRWMGTLAFVAVLPVAYHCLWALGYQAASVRVALHSALGCAFFGVFSTKMLALRMGRGLHSLTFPMLGGALFGLLAALWATSSLWVFTGG